jgi:hypothetical protein
MSQRTRGFAATLAVIAVLFVGAAPALAYADEGLDATRKATPVLLDAVILRPLGLLLTLGGVVAFVPTGGIVALMRPTDIGKPFNLLVANPFRYTFMDPLGEHPAPRDRASS